MLWQSDLPRVYRRVALYHVEEDIMHIFNQYYIYIKPFLPTDPSGVGGRARAHMDDFAAALQKPTLVHAVQHGAKVCCHACCWPHAACAHCLPALTGDCTTQAHRPQQPTL